MPTFTVCKVSLLNMLSSLAGPVTGRLVGSSGRCLDGSQMPFPCHPDIGQAVAVINGTVTPFVGGVIPLEQSAAILVRMDVVIAEEAKAGNAIVVKLV